MNAETEKALLQLQCLKSAVKQAVADTDNAMQQPGIDPGEKAYIDALKDRLTGELENIENVETLIQGERKLTVGVFGFPSRGKSTLLNALLGTDMLPMDGRPGTTRLGTMLIKNEPKNYRSAYRIRRIFKGAALEDGVCRAEDVGTILNYFSSTESGEKNLKTQRIEIEGPFDSFIDDDLIFIDTPAIVEESVSSSDTGHDWERDRKYALEILSTVDIVIFCIRADAPEKNEVKLYNETFFDKYEPINVITFANERDDDMTILDLKRYLKETYHLMLPDTVAVDAKKAVEIVAAAKKEGKRIKDEFEAKLVGENLVGFKELKEIIHERVGHKDGHIGKRVARLKELYNDLKGDAFEQSQGRLVLPEIADKKP